MINSIYFDADETIISSHFIRGETDFSEGYMFDFLLEDGEKYATFMRPFAQAAIDYARALVGVNNVFILTAATHDYMCAIDRRAGFGFGPEKIFARHHWNGNRDPWNGSHEHNVLIDNLPYYDNFGKCDFLGIRKTVDTQYLQIRDFWGSEYADYKFDNVVKEFLDKLV